MSEKLKEIGLMTPSLAQAQAVENLSNPSDVRNLTLSVLQVKDLQRLNLFNVLTQITGWNSLQGFRDDELRMRMSVSRKGSRGRDDLVMICQSQNEEKGALDTFKEKITSFFRSGT